MPKMLDDKAATDLCERLNDPEQNQESYHQYCQMQGEDLLQFISFKPVNARHELRLVRNPDEVTELVAFLLDHENQSVLYYNCVEKVDIQLTQRTDQPVRQVMIWRELRVKGGADTHGLVESVFFEFLIDQYCIAVSDSEQTRDGKRMWEKLINLAIENGLEAGRMDRDTYEYHQILNLTDLNSASSWLWGTEDVHANRLAVIMKL